MTLDRLKKILNECLGLNGAEHVTADSRLAEDLGADSLDTVEIAMAVEDEFDVEFSDDEAGAIVTVGDLVSRIDEKAAAR